MVLKILQNTPFLLALILLELIYLSTGVANDYITISVYITYIISLYLIDKRFLLRYSYIIFYITTNIIGVFLIETNNLFLTELMTFSHNNNSLLLLTIAHVLFIETIRFLHNTKQDKIVNSVNSKISFFRFEITKLKLVEIFLFIIFVTFLVLFLRVIDKPFFLVKLDRFLYKENYLPFLVDKITNSALYLTPLISMYFFYTKKKKALLLLSLIVLYLFWIGHKFSFFIVIFYIISLPFIRYGSNKTINKIFKSSVVIVFALLIVVSIQSIIVYQRDFSENSLYLKQRLAQQGQLWWATYGLMKEQEGRLNEIKDELKTYYKLNVDSNDLLNSGMYKIMQLTTPHDVFIRKIEDKNSRYAYSTQASIYYYFKGVGVIIFSIISGVFYFYINRGLVSNLISFNIIPSILYARLMFISHVVLMQSDFNKLFSIEVIVIVYILLILSIIKKISSSRNYATIPKNYQNTTYTTNVRINLF
ncbi:DUF6418 domain-containing protein [Geobacillus kaustophilus]|jgi:Family of unknown function (DUF6418)|uniref:DUF6418 domain-containing protein n=1 Tax=Geobacillus kaustophilus TaxID=1462 RepID=UPI0005CD1D31|nr:DUF6418 domain-containing protein [Geobacillus kaustophilus]